MNNISIQMLNNIETMRDRDQKYAENKTKSNMSVSNKEMRGPFIFSGESVDAWIYLMDMYFQENRMKEEHKIKVALNYCDSKVTGGWIQELAATGTWDVFASRIRRKYAKGFAFRNFIVCNKEDRKR